MPAATRQVLVGLGHKTGHDAKACSDFFTTCFEQNSAVSLLQCLTKADSNFVNAWPGFGVQAFNRHTKGQHLVHDGVEKTTVLVHAQQ